jgi:hypothetical protein
MRIIVMAASSSTANTMPGPNGHGDTDPRKRRGPRRGVTFVVVGWFAGRNRSGTAARTWLSGGLETVGSSMADGPVGGAGTWVAANAHWLRIAAGALGPLVLLWGNQVTMPRLAWSLVLVAVLLAIVQILVGAGTRARPTGSTPAPAGDAVG